MRGKLSPKLEEFIRNVNVAAAEFKASGVPLTPQQARTNLKKLSAFVTDVPEIQYQKNWLLSFVDEEGIERQIPTLVLSEAPEQSRPILVYFHGGGHMCGDLEQYDPMCRKMALASRCHVVVVDYRLSPEHPYPAGIVDAESAILSLGQLRPLQHNGQVFIGGDSAGGAICGSILMRIAQGRSLVPKGLINKQVLIYPSLDYSGSTPSYLENGHGYLLEKERIAWYFDHYFQANEERRAVSPLFGPLLPEPKQSEGAGAEGDFPKTLIITAECDPLRDEGLKYKERLGSHGVKVVHQHFDGLIHAFMNLEDLIKEECEALYSTIGKFLQES